MTDNFLQGVVKQLAHELFHNHTQISDEQTKEKLRDMLESDNEWLWSIFEISRIKPFSENDMKAQMKNWKKDSKKAYDDLYNPSYPSNPNSDTFLSLIIKYVFVSEDEQTEANAI
ncbi:15567_t:CDS:2 [Dentiscutata heterogama]|uniref:15567_t:CDS:1 n=1 Tax=Dentiscutata heterogama TaxID=1316150 RepID=A0ACA9NA40_9GLOM|nr:15567_t:CDS:2 [Dentiscutata heterogama]